jgi:dihydroorotate dehydrogenase (NAD+) catalytic subunit
MIRKIKETPLTVKIGRITLKNPVMPASGTFEAQEFSEFFPIHSLGAIITKTITYYQKPGNQQKRTFETPSGLINSIGLENPGLKYFAKYHINHLRSFRVPIIVSVGGNNINEYLKIIDYLEEDSGIFGYELNLSCPNVKTGMSILKDMKTAEELFAKCRKITRRTLIAKISYETGDFIENSKLIEHSGFDAVSITNTFKALAIDIKTRKPVIKNVIGGLSGPCIKPIALRMVWEISKNVKIPVIGVGGISSWQDAVEFIVAGATALCIGSMGFVNPDLYTDIINGLENYLSENKIDNINKLRGSLNV